MVRVCLCGFSDVFVQLLYLLTLQAWVSVKRVAALLTEEELDDNAVIKILNKGIINIMLSTYFALESKVT